MHYLIGSSESFGKVEKTEIIMLIFKIKINGEAEVLGRNWTPQIHIVCKSPQTLEIGKLYSETVFLILSALKGHSWSPTTDSFCILGILE